MNFYTFLTTAKKSRRFIISMEGCFLCKQYIRDMQIYVDSGMITVVDAMVEDEENVIGFGIDGVPVSLVYDENGNEKFRKYGVLNEKQKMEFIRA